MQAFDVNDSGQVAGIAGNQSLMDSLRRTCVCVRRGVDDATAGSIRHGLHARVRHQQRGDGRREERQQQAVQVQHRRRCSTQLAFPAGGGGGGYAMDINTPGDIVGWEYTTFPNTRPILWDGGVTPIARWRHPPGR